MAARSLPIHFGCFWLFLGGFFFLPVVCYILSSLSRRAINLTRSRRQHLCFGEGCAGINLDGRRFSPLSKVGKMESRWRHRCCQRNKKILGNTYTWLFLKRGLCGDRRNRRQIITWSGFAITTNTLRRSSPRSKNSGADVPFKPERLSHSSRLKQVFGGAPAHFWDASGAIN